MISNEFLDPLDDAEVICEICENAKAVWDCQACCAYTCEGCFQGDVCVNCYGDENGDYLADDAVFEDEED